MRGVIRTEVAYRLHTSSIFLPLSCDGRGYHRTSHNSLISILSKIYTSYICTYHNPDCVDRKYSPRYRPQNTLSCHLRF